MPWLIYSLIAAGGWIVGSTVNNATEAPAAVINTPETVASNTINPYIKLGLYVAGGLLAFHYGKKLIAKI